MAAAKNATPAPAPAPAPALPMPETGGSWIRQADGTLVKHEPPAEEAEPKE